MTALKPRTTKIGEQKTILCLLIAAPLFLCCIFFSAKAQEPPQLKIAVLKVGASSKFAAHLTDELTAHKTFKMLDPELARAAANGAKIENPFNLSIEQAKNLGVLIDCNFLLIVKSETVRRSSFARPVYFESGAIVFLASAQTGRLESWTDRYFEADAPDAAEKLLFASVAPLGQEFAAKIIGAATRERREKLLDSPAAAVLIEDLPADAGSESDAGKFRVPLPYKRLRPEYTAAAARRNIEATVDVTAELDASGAVVRAEIARWAGFDLDESALAAVRKMQFRPALKDGKPLAIRILLRYNFRDLAK